jgi:hypothetical protein
MNSIASDSSLGVSMAILSAILVSMPLVLINLALAASKCQRNVTFAIHGILLAVAALVAISLMMVDMHADLVKALARYLPLGLFLQTVVLFFRRKQESA